MKHRWLFVVWIALWTNLALGENAMKPSQTGTSEALHSVITKQLEAFRVHDYRTAYLFAADDIRAVYSLEVFEHMVRMGYPAIAESLSATYGLTMDDGADAIVTVQVTGPDKKVVSYQYALHLSGDIWTISGVTSLKEETVQT